MANEEIMGDLGIPRRRLVELDAFKSPKDRRQRQVDLGRRQIDPQTLPGSSAEGDEVFLGLFRAFSSFSSRCCCCSCGCCQPAVRVKGLWVREFHRVLVLEQRCHGHGRPRRDDPFSIGDGFEGRDPLESPNDSVGEAVAFLDDGVEVRQGF